MKFKHGTRRRALEYEKDWVRRWKEEKTFEKSVENRSKENSYVFYDGPPFISGSPHHGTLLSSIVKDAIPRYQTMKGKRVERVWGWDCHGLPAERFTEKKLGISSRKEVIEYGIENYINATRENMIQTSSEWEDVVDRIGRWVDFKGAYKTMDKEYMESIWWAFKTLYEKGKIYEGERVLMYCTLDGTPLSKAEVTMDSGAYQDVTDPSVYVKFRLYDDSDMDPEDLIEANPWDDDYSEKYDERVAKIEDEIGKTPKTYLLAWTTTPWTLPANTAVAINKDMAYVKVEYEGDYLIVAKDRVKDVFVDEKKQPLEYKVVEELKGEDIRDLSYVPLFSDRGEGAHHVWHADYVSAEDGTGIVHIAPAYGEEDFNLANDHNIPVVHTLDENGAFTEGDWKGENVWEINKQIAKDLKERGVVWKIDYIRHSYPHCHRCNTKLMYRAHPSWFVAIDDQRTMMLEKNEPINWFPKHVKNGRFEKTVLSAPDWNISRDRFWATAMPVWKSESGKVKVIGSYAELKELSGVELEDYHRPWIDHVKFTIDGEEYTRIDKVMDSWFEAGSMPFAQFHYPFENKDKFEANFPGDFIVEYIGQVRAWFYYMHAMSVALFGENSFKNVIVTGNVAGNDGRKMSKSYGNYTDPNELMDKFSADSLRFLLLSSPLLNGEDFALQDKEVGDVARKLSMVWNMYDFFTMYAEVDGWEYDGKLEDPIESLKNPLDTWIISRLYQLVEEVERQMDGYNIPDAMSPILPFLDDASNWYVRRSRRRFWKSEDDGDKNDAYKTLHYVLVRLAYVLAPFTPFLAEELYQNLTGDTESIHLKDWLPAGHVNELIVRDMAHVRFCINEGLSQRAQAGVKVRQPLAEATLKSDVSFEAAYDEILLEELNVKSISREKPKKPIDPSRSFLENVEERGLPQADWIKLDFTLTPELRREGLMRELIRHVQAARKQAGLNVDDRIQLSLSTEDEQLQKAIEEHLETIKAETLANEVVDAVSGFDTTVKVEGEALAIALKKA